MKTEEPLFPEWQTTWLSPQQELVLSQELSAKKDWELTTLSKAVVSFALHILWQSQLFLVSCFRLPGSRSAPLRWQQHLGEESIHQTPHLSTVRFFQSAFWKRGEVTREYLCWRKRGVWGKKTLLLSRAYGRVGRRQLLTLCGLIIHSFRRFSLGRGEKSFDFYDQRRASVWVLWSIWEGVTIQKFVCFVYVCEANDSNSSLWATECFPAQMVRMMPGHTHSESWHMPQREQPGIFMPLSGTDRWQHILKEGNTIVP